MNVQNKEDQFSKIQALFPSLFVEKECTYLKTIKEKKETKFNENLKDPNLSVEDYLINLILYKKKGLPKTLVKKKGEEETEKVDKRGRKRKTKADYEGKELTENQQRRQIKSIQRKEIWLEKTKDEREEYKKKQKEENEMKRKKREDEANKIETSSETKNQPNLEKKLVSETLPKFDLSILQPIIENKQEEKQEKEEKKSNTSEFTQSDFGFGSKDEKILQGKTLDEIFQSTTESFKVLQQEEKVERKYNFDSVSKITPFDEFILKDEITNLNATTKITSSFFRTLISQLGQIRLKYQKSEIIKLANVPLYLEQLLKILESDNISSRRVEIMGKCNDIMSTCANYLFGMTNFCLSSFDRYPSTFLVLQIKYFLFVSRLKSITDVEVFSVLISLIKVINYSYNQNKINVI